MREILKFFQDCKDDLSVYIFHLMIPKLGNLPLEELEVPRPQSPKKTVETRWPDHGTADKPDCDKNVFLKSNPYKLCINSNS